MKKAKYMHEDADPWLTEVLGRIPDDEVWSWVEQLHCGEVTEKVVHDDIFGGGIKLFSYLSDTMICQLSMLPDEIPTWAVAKAVKYWVGQGWELPK